jgi:hypothetical protein
MRIKKARDEAHRRRRAARKCDPVVTLVRVCTDNLTAGVAVMKSTQDGA